MHGRTGKISVVAVRNANNRLVSKSRKSTLIVSDDSKNGEVAFRAVYGRKAFSLTISRAKIKKAYAQSIAETIL